jgi:hypothetical protein
MVRDCFSFLQSAQARAIEAQFAAFVTQDGANNTKTATPTSTP